MRLVMIKTYKKIIITKRDQDLIKYLFSHKGATIKQIHRDLFTESSLRAAYLRTKKLKENGIIESRSFLEKVYTGVFNVTKKGLKFVYDLDEDLDRKELKSANFLHDTKLIDLKKILTQVDCFDFYATENEIEANIIENDNYPIKAFRDLHTDALLGIKWDNEYLNFAIEFENSIKSTRKYHDNLTNYYGYPIIHNVVYFTSDEKTKTRIINIDKKIIIERNQKYSKIYVANINELKKPIKSLKIFNSSNDFIEFNWNKEITI